MTPADAPPAFSGFANESRTGSFAAQFAALDGDEPDQPPFVPTSQKTAPDAGPADKDFDFEAFMQENTPASGKPEAADTSFDFDAFMRENEPDGTEKADAHTPAEGEQSVDRDTWFKIVLNTERSFAPLIGHLTGSTAVIRGLTLCIRPADNAIRFIAPEAILEEYLAPVAETILGRRYKIKYEELQ